MPQMNNRFVIDYNSFGLFLGPSPATGYHFIDSNGLLRDDYASNGNTNLLFHVPNIQSIEFSKNNLNVGSQNLGSHGLVDSFEYSMPQFSLNFSYIDYGADGEYLMGFNVNRGHPTENETPYYGHNNDFYLLEGFDSFSLQKKNLMKWPLDHNDERNIFVGFVSDEDDGQDFLSDGVKKGVLCFGDCHINNYSFNASVNSFPIIGVSYECDNSVIYDSGSVILTGLISPALNKKTATQSTSRFNLPIVDAADESFEHKKVFRPQDIKLSIYELNKESNINAFTGIGSRDNNPQLIFEGFPVQNFNISIPLPRRPLQSLTHKLPIVKKLENPIEADINLTLLTSDFEAENSRNKFFNNKQYDFNVSIFNPDCEIDNELMKCYIIKGANLISQSNSSDIGSKSTTTLSYKVEISKNNPNRGVFFSGILSDEIYFPAI